MITDILDAICIYTLIIVLCKLNLSMKESRMFRKILSWHLLNKYESDPFLSFAELVQPAAFSTRASLEWQSSSFIHFYLFTEVQNLPVCATRWSGKFLKVY